MAIYGIRDNEGRERVEESLESTIGAISVDVSSFLGRAVVEHAASCPPNRLLRSVEDAGCFAEILSVRKSTLMFGYF
ncbi:MAG: heavy-metal-associated domain-containing protein [Phycisphaerales bacterium]|nr:MAG: heavy-metal-associated domain-containing protein [Phycisphaerales bacterium]